MLILRPDHFSSNTSDGSELGRYWALVTTFVIAPCKLAQRVGEK